MSDGRPDSDPLRIEKLVAGGDGLARAADGRVVFVSGGLPGELIRVSGLDMRKDFARAEVEEVLEASPARVEPPCGHVAGGCGGCDLQHAAPGAQPSLKLEIVSDALRRLGRLSDPLVEAGPVGPSEAYRTTVRSIVEGGRAGYRRRASHEVVPVDSCLVAHAGIEEILAEGSFAGVEEVTIRVGERTGERMVFATPTARQVRVPDGVLVVGADELHSGTTASIHEQAAGRTWRISARSFFQASAWGADTLAGLVVDAVRDPEDTALETVVDLYGGVGLLAGALASACREQDRELPRLVLVESSRSAVDDARHNLADIGSLRVTRRRVESWRPAAADTVIADPARAGLGRDGVAAVVATGCDRLVLVSCDAASLGRDTRLLADAGLRHVRSTLVDLFPQTSHVEVVTSFVRQAA